MIRPKSCPRCRTGDTIVDFDDWGWYAKCLTCGHVRDLEGAAPGQARMGFPRRRGGPDAGEPGGAGRRGPYRPRTRGDGHQ